MHRPSFGVTVLCGVAAILVLGGQAATQERRGSRIAVQMVNGREAAAREVLVRFRPTADPGEIARLGPRADTERTEALGRGGLVRLRSRSLDAATLLAFFSSHPDVAFAEPNYVVHAFTRPNDPELPRLWGLENLGQTVNGGLPGLPGADIGAPDAWDVSLGSDAHVVAVIDSGIDYTHPDLSANVWTAPAPFSVTVAGETIACPAGTHGFNVLARTCDPMDDNGHGTHVAGTVGAAGNNGLGVVGVNWVTRMMALKILDADGSGTVADAVTAIEFAIQAREAFAAGGSADVRVISASWGGTEFSQALLDAIAAADAHDMLFVAAAGNSGFPNDWIPTYPASYDVPNVIAVAATTNADARAWFRTTEHRPSTSARPGWTCSRPRPAVRTGSRAAPPWRPRTSPAPRRWCCRGVRWIRPRSRKRSSERWRSSRRSRG